MTDRELRDAAACMNAALRRIPAPEPPARRSRPAVVALAAATAVLLLVGGWALFTGSDGPLDAAAQAPGSPAAEPSPCPVTAPAGAFVPPEPWPAQAPTGGWHGTADLWTQLPHDGQRQLLASGDKYFWWSRHFDAGEEPEPAITVTARRLDAASPPVVEGRATNGSRFDMGSFMLVGVELPAGGCWEITGEYRGHTLTYVAEVLDGGSG